MINLELPEPYLRAVAERVVKGFVLLSAPRQMDAIAEVKAVALALAVGARPPAEFSDWELLVKNVFDEYPVEKWEAEWAASLRPVVVVEPEKKKPAAPVAAPKKEKK